MAKISLLKKLVGIELVLVFLVILAGSVVRMTGSGMGCPDWPKCFGLLVPPTERAQLEWQPNREFARGQVIIRDEALWLATKSFTSGTEYNPNNWEKYTKHDYAKFNAAHTWVEYINRLLGALSGVPMILIFLISLFLIRSRPLITLLGTAGLFLLGFEAWLGKTVVDGNLVPHQITYHMLGAFALLAVLLLLQSRLRDPGSPGLPRNMLFLGWVALGLTLVQVVLGTQVREVVDELYKVAEGADRATWIDRIGTVFPVHRSFSILVLLVNGWIFLKQRNQRPNPWRYVMALLGLSIALGIVLSYLGMPAWAQPAHLLAAAFLFTSQVHVLLRSSSR